jgi:hypothetical protein
MPPRAHVPGADMVNRGAPGLGPRSPGPWEFFVLAVIYARRMLRGEAHPPGPARLIVGVALGIFSVGCFGLLPLGMLVLIGIAAGVR